MLITSRAFENFVGRRLGACAASTQRRISSARRASGACPELVCRNAALVVARLANSRARENPDQGGALPRRRGSPRRAKRALACRKNSTTSESGWSHSRANMRSSGPLTDSDTRATAGSQPSNHRAHSPEAQS